MKGIVSLGILFCALRMQAQVAGESEVLVCYDKTVNILFPYAIVSEDHGSDGVIVQQRKGADHILQVKANRKKFTPTSLSVVTSDGRLYSFLVRYADDVYTMNYVMDVRQAVAVTELFHNERKLEEEAAMITGAASNIHRRAKDDFSILTLRGLYISRNGLWLKTAFTNYTTVPFPVGFIKFFVRDRRRVKNAAVQEREVVPIFQQVPGAFTAQSNNRLLFAFDPFELNAHQQLIMQVGERNGNRFIQMRIRPKHFKRIAALQ